MSAVFYECVVHFVPLLALRVIYAGCDTGKVEKERLGSSRYGPNDGRETKLRPNT